MRFCPLLPWRSLPYPFTGGSVAPLALERLQGLHGDGTPVVLLAVYGNRDYEHALDDLDRFMTERGFVTVAAGTFVGEHSYSTPQTPVAAGRPVRSIPRLQNPHRLLCTAQAAACTVVNCKLLIVSQWQLMKREGPVQYRPLLLRKAEYQQADSFPSRVIIKCG